MVGLIDDFYIKYPINSRIKVNDNYGTVKYVGEVTGYSGIWIGVEWDDIKRGKHDGFTNGYRYFKTDHPTSGSMVKPEKISKFETLQKSIEERYQSNNTQDIIDKNLVDEANQCFRASKFEIVGMDIIAKKLSKTEELIDISVSKSTVNEAGDLSAFKKLESLNLTSTLIWNWNTIGDILKQIPTLTYINLSSNCFQLPTQKEINELQPYFRNLKRINLGKCRLKTWENVIITSQLFPYIESLSIQENEIEDIKPFDCNSVFKNLKELDLHLNKIRNFDGVLNLANIKTLECLLLMNNEIDAIRLPYCDFDKTLENVFPSLELLNINNNPIQDWFVTFNELDKLPKLTNLSAKTKEELSKFSLAIALLPNLKIFNKGLIMKDDRRGAEYDLWKGYGLEWQRTENNPEARKQFCLKCRAYLKLVEKYGSPVEFVNVRPQIQNLVKICIKNKNNGEIFEKRVPRKITVQTLQGLIIKHFKIGNTMPKLSYSDLKHPDVVVNLDNLSKNLDYYSIQDGDIVSVEW